MAAVGRPAKYGPGESYGIPHRCLTPLGFENLLTAGKIISCDRMAQGSARVMPVCLCTGEAAGVAAVLSGAESESKSNQVNRVGGAADRG